MTEPPRRWRFQIHLSTAVVMMFVAGGLIWMNVSPRKNLAFPDGRAGRISEVMDRTSSMPMTAGWPLSLVEWYTDNGKRYRGPFLYLGAMGDVTTSLAILFTVWFVCEWLIRRRAARKGA